MRSPAAFLSSIQAAILPCEAWLRDDRCGCRGDLPGEGKGVAPVCRKVMVAGDDVVLSPHPLISPVDKSLPDAGFVRSFLQRVA